MGKKKKGKRDPTLMMLKEQQKVDFASASSAFCNVCAFKKEKCKTKWKCGALRDFQTNLITLE